MTTLIEHIRLEHQELRPHLEQLRVTADAVGSTSIDVLREMTEECLRFLVHDLVPHAETEDEILYETVGQLLGSRQATATMSRDHEEVKRLTAELSTLHGGLMAGHRLTEETARDLRRVLYGLHAIVRLHFAKEDEVYVALLEARLDDAQEQELLRRLSEE